MKKVSQAEKIAAGYIFPQIRERLDEAALAHWSSLSDAERNRYYDNAITEHQVSHADTNGFISNRLAQGAAEGKGGCLYNAIISAYSNSDDSKLKSIAHHEAFRAEPVACCFCKGEHPWDESLGFDGKHVGYICIPEKNLEAMKVFFTNLEWTNLLRVRQVHQHQWKKHLHSYYEFVYVCSTCCLQIRDIPEEVKDGR